MEEKKEVCIVVPMYRMNFTPYEKISFDQTYKMLSNFPIIFIHPKSIDLTHLRETYPLISFQSFDNEYFKDIAGYNRLMLSTELYQRFDTYKYILIAQLDTYIFRQNLLDFCQNDYDYIGAPWRKKKLYQTWIFSYFLDKKKARYNKLDKPCRQNLYGQVGNGGLSLRKVQSHIEALEKHSKRRDFYLSHPGIPLYNEDVFFAIEVPEFKYPTADEALAFSFDKYPRYCYQLLGNQLPFGCHGWWKRKWRKFWMKFIEFPID